VPEPASSVRADLSPEIDMVFACCLEKDPNRRFPDAAALAALLGVMLAPFGSGPAPSDTVLTPIGDEDTALAPVPIKPD